jgi:predicted  nucleic acid-binding Zn-ribbon protein
MTEYSDAAAAVRRAREARDGARDDLYHVQLYGHAVDGARRRAARGEGVRDPAADATLRRLRANLHAATTRRQAVAKQLEPLSSVDADVARLRERLDAAPGASAAFTREIGRLAAALGRAKTEPERERLQSNIKALQSQRAALADATGRDRDALDKARTRKAVAGDLLEESRSLDTQIATLRRDIDATNVAAGGIDLDEAKAEARGAIDAARRTRKERDADVRAAIDQLYDGRTPQELIESWNDTLPIALLPVRVETRWRVETEPDTVRELWVRIYPDDIGVTNHEPVLTVPEIDHGRQYWIAFRAADRDADAGAAAWNALARRFGGNRAAWVARQTRPANWDAVLPDPELPLEFPELPTKPDAWTAAPHSRVLPDRFVLMAWGRDALRIVEVGRPVDDIVILGPAPIDGSEDDASIEREVTDNTLTFGESFRWVRDFDRAVECGLGFRVAVTADDVQEGFARLLVLGLKLSADAAEAQAMVEAHIENHHYSRAGLEILRQGTPTNNTDGSDSGYTRGGGTGVAAASPERFTPTDDRAAATDGQRVADFLGIGYAPLQHVDGADHADHAEAVAMNRALYAGTLGYYLDHMLNEVIDDSVRGSLRRHFTDHVTGRGPLPAIRVGSQPYGVLPTSSLARWQPSKRTGSVDGPTALLPNPFEATLLAALRVFDMWWWDQRWSVAQLGDAGDASATLLKVLGLHPTSAEFHHRVGYSFDYLRNLDSFAYEGADFEDVLKMAIEKIQARGLLLQLGYADARADGTPKATPLLLQLIWRHYQTELDPKQLIDGQPLSETAGIKPYNNAGTTYLDWLLAHAADAAALEAQDLGGAPRPGALLYMLLHFSLVMEGGRAVHRWLGDRQVNADELVRSRKFLNVTGPSPSVWEVFRAPANRIVANEPSSQPLLALMHTPQVAGDAGQPVQEQRAALAALRSLPTARLERALVEHLDTLSYRLDAWQTSLFANRLFRQRRLDGAVALRRTGVYLGAYGYLENVKRADRGRTPVARHLRPDVVRDLAGDLYREARNGGYVHAPSLNHATAAALLRNGYLTHATPSDPHALAVNLSSARVQRAKYLIEGIANGQSLEVLLGVQFERGLHDWTTRDPEPVILDQLKPLFRAHFPIVRTRVPQAANAAAGASEVHEDHQVTNGLTLARTTAPFPYGIDELSALDAPQQDAIRAEKAAIENTLDALRDVLTAESAYQLALGNFDRAAAVLQSVGSGTLPPEVEVLNTPRGTGISFTQRLAVHFDATIAASPWGASPSARQQLDPPLNAWVGNLLGAPDTIACRVAAVDANGTVLVDNGNPIEGTVTLAALDLQPIDFVYVVRSQTDPSGAAELETRVRYAFARARGLADETIVRITFADAGGDPAVRSFAEVLPLADRLRKLLGTARPLDARHFQSASNDVPADADNPGRIDVAELSGRVNARLAAVRGLFPALQTTTDTARTSANAADVDALRDALVGVARAGLSYAMPRSAVGGTATQRDVLVQQADALLARAAALGPATDKQLADAAAATRAERVASELGAAVKAWLGSDVVLLPRFVFGDAAAVGQAHAARDELLQHARNTGGVPLPVEEWLHGAACVRSLVHDFEMVRAMADATRDAPLEIAPLQFPFRSGDSWLGAEYPPTLEVVHDTVSIVQHLPQGFAAAGAQCGLLVDEWTESVPLREEVTGLCFNFNAPNSAPPQAVLLAVSPRETGSWSWDDLVDSVLDTFRRARLRAIEPDVIGDMAGIGTLLPAVVAEFGTSAASVSLDYAMVMDEIRIPVLAMRANEG